MVAEFSKAEFLFTEGERVMAKKWKDIAVDSRGNGGLSIREYMLASVIRGMGREFNMLTEHAAKKISGFVDYLEKVEEGK